MTSFEFLFFVLLGDVCLVYRISKNNLSITLQNFKRNELATCPLNARHVMLKKNYREHMDSCPDRAVVEAMMSNSKEFWNVSFWCTFNRHSHRLNQHVISHLSLTWLSINSFLRWISLRTFRVVPWLRYKQEVDIGWKSLNLRIDYLLSGFWIVVFHN